MKLRLRVGLATVAVVIPALALMLWPRLSERERALIRATADFALARLERERSECEADPNVWPLIEERETAASAAEVPRTWLERGGPSAAWAARIQLFAYDERLASGNPAAPEIPGGMKAAAQISPASIQERHFDLHGRPALDLLLQTPWGSGPCAFVLARVPGWPSAGGPLPLGVLLPATLIALGSVLFATAPIVRRIRLLTRQVRGSLQGSYEGAITVSGNDEIGELARAFSDATREIRCQTARQAQREQTLRTFLENTTHDVMIPLTVLQGYLASSQQRLANHEPIDAATISRAMNEAHYMASLIHNLAMAARLEAGEPLLSREPVNLNGVVERSVSRHLPIARQRCIEVDRGVPEPALWAVGDVTLIEQALSNIVYNAVRYNREGGHVAVVLERGPAARFVMRIIDDGPGIPEAERATLLERYQRGNAARSREPNGSGLGLNIAFRISQVHGWEFSLEESEFGGLEIEIAGPLAETPASVR